VNIFKSLCKKSEILAKSICYDIMIQYNDITVLGSVQTKISRQMNDKIALLQKNNLIEKYEG
jgi:hypothetical protein